MNEKNNLKDLVDKLPEISGLIYQKSNRASIEYIIKDGYSFGFNLYTEDNISIMKLVMTKDSYFEEYKHNVNEWIFLYEGTVEVIMNNITIILTPGMFFSFPSGLTRTIKANTNVKAICITIPKEQDYA